MRSPPQALARGVLPSASTSSPFASRFQQESSGAGEPPVHHYLRNELGTHWTNETPLTVVRSCRLPASHSTHRNNRNPVAQVSEENVCFGWLKLVPALSQIALNHGE